MLSAHVVAHTHWDREWYQPFVRFRQGLVSLVDELLDDPPSGNESFLLDGQAIVIEDYLDVRPERAAELTSLLRSGRIEAGPWYVLADELIPSGEAIVRNLLLGRRVLRRLDALSPRVLYCPDSFGHPAALPMIAAGFGLPLIILWRGYGCRRWPQSDTVIWRGPDGQRVAVYHLPPNGYEFASDLPLDAHAAAERWSRMRAMYAPRAATGQVLLPNGADHHARQRAQREAVRMLAAAARDTGDTVIASSLEAFAEHLLGRVRAAELAEVRGELRDSYGYTWTLQGTFATRAAQKRRNARVERALLRDAEPWAALARLRAGKSRLPLTVIAWRTLLQAHPHDTLCGCSIDAVAEAMHRRLEDALTQAVGIRDDAIADIIGYDADAARTAKSAWRPVVVLRNPAPRPRSGVALVEIKQFIADVAVGPGSAPNAGMARAAMPELPSLGPNFPLQILHRTIGHDRLESPRHYPDNDLVAVTRAAVWIDDVPAYGTTALPFGATTKRAVDPKNIVRCAERVLENGLVRVTLGDGGLVSVLDVATGCRIDDLLLIEDRVDEGDLYTPAIRGQAATVEFRESSMAHPGPLIGELRLRWQLRSIHGKERTSDLAVSISLIAGSSLIRLRVQGVNRHRGHRLRLGVRTGVPRGELWADAAFGPVRREPLDIPAEDTLDELPVTTAPLHRYVSLFEEGRGATLFSDGLAEYEATAGGDLHVSLLRAVGELSRNDLPERRGHAGWPSPTPKAQSLGAFSARIALLLHGPRTADTIDAIERTADDFLVPLEGRTLRSATRVPPAISGVELRGRGLAFSTLKESEDGKWLVARCVNLLDEPVEGQWHFGPPIVSAMMARLDESPLEEVSVRGNVVRFRALPRATVTILVA